MHAEMEIQAFILDKDGELNQVMPKLYLLRITVFRPHKGKTTQRLVLT